MSGRRAEDEKDERKTSRRRAEDEQKTSGRRAEDEKDEEDRSLKTRPTFSELGLARVCSRLDGFEDS
jgi:hypothetical protein